MIKKYLKPIFNSTEISKDLIFINCTLGYDGKINLLFADKEYDNVKFISREITHLDPTKKIDIGNLPMRNLKYIPSSPQDYKLIILGDSNKVVEFNNQKINYTNGLQVDDCKFCFIFHCLYKTMEDNGIITDGEGKIIRKFTVGTGINDVQTNGKHEIWVSYADYGIYSHSDSLIEKGGLNCFDSSGNKTYSYHNSPIIDECNSLNVLSEEDVLINIYSGSIEHSYALGVIKEKKLNRILEWEESTKYMAYYNSKLLVISNYMEEVKSKFKIIDITDKTKDIEVFEFFNEKNDPLHCVHAQKEQLFFWKNNCLYKVSITELV